MLEITRCSACLIFRQRLIPSTTTFWSRAWRGRMVFVRLRLTGSVLIYSIAYNQFFYDGVSSSVCRLVCGQGSVLGPLLFLLYTADVGELAASLGLSSHFYADHSQLYIRGVTLHLMGCSSAGWSWELSSSRNGRNLIDSALILRRRSFFGARPADGVPISGSSVSVVP